MLCIYEAKRNAKSPFEGGTELCFATVACGELAVARFFIFNYLINFYIYNQLLNRL